VFYAGFIGYNIYQFYSDKEMSKYAIDGKMCVIL
jgi:hypothetical protein